MAGTPNLNPERKLLARINEMVAQEADLRRRLQAGSIDVDTEHERLGALEVELDQAWDLLRQRRAKAEFGQDPNDAKLRTAHEVESYES